MLGRTDVIGAVAKHIVAAVSAVVVVGCGCGTSAPEPQRPCVNCQWLIPAATVVNPWRIAVDGKHVYWVSADTVQLFRVPVAGGDVELVASWLEASSQLALDEQAVYSLEAIPFVTGRGQLRRIDKTSGETSIASRGEVVGGPITTSDGIYFVEQVNGGAPELVRLTPSQPTPDLVMRLPQETYRPFSFALGSGLAVWCQSLKPVLVDLASVPSGDLKIVALDGGTTCPSLGMIGDRVYALGPVSGASLWRVEPGPPTDLLLDFRRGSLSSAGSYLLSTERENGRIRLIDADGAVAWSETAPVEQPAPAVTDGTGIYVAGERGLVRYPWPFAGGE